MSIDTTIVKARKQHWCDWCGEAVEAGSTYATGFDPEGPAQWHYHLECLVARRTVDEVENWRYTRGGVEDRFDVATYEQSLALHAEGALT